MAEERKRTTVRTLYETVTVYIDDNKRSSDVAERWLCSALESMLVTISGILKSRPVPADLPAIEAFQAAEIEAQIGAKRKEIENLERDLKAVKRPKAA
jgi:hypothetical protein